MAPQQHPLPLPTSHAKDNPELESPTYPPDLQPSGTSTQPTIDTFENDSRAEALLATFDESQAKGAIHGTPVSSRSMLFQTIFVAIVCFPQVSAEAHIGMLSVPLVDIGIQVGTQDEHQSSWFPASYGLTVGVFLIAAGRMGDIYGSKSLWVGGSALCAIANLSSGFCDTKIPFNICRALAGIGTAASSPNAIGVLGKTYGSAKARAVVFSIVGASAPTGFVVGGSIGGFFTEEANTRWIFWFTAILCLVIAIIGQFIIPASPRVSSGYVDYVGAASLVLALGSFNFSWNQGPVVGWPVPYVYVLLIVSIGFAIAFVWWERRMGNERALIPSAVLSKNSSLTSSCSYMGWSSFGLYASYLVLFLRNIRGFENTSVLAAQISPSFPAGVIAASFCPWAVRRFAGHKIFFVSMLSFCGGNLMAASTPVDSTYWAVTFPSLSVIAAGPDSSYTTGQLIVTASVGAEYQGIAGGIVMMVVYYSQSIGLGMAATVERYVSGGDQLKGYRAVFWFGTGLAGLAAVIVGSFVRMDKSARSHE